MMTKLYKVTDIMARYQCTRQTAVRYIRQMEHLEKPYAVTEKALATWEQSRTVRPASEVKAEYLLAKIKRRTA